MFGGSSSSSQSHHPNSSYSIAVLSNYSNSNAEELDAAVVVPSAAESTESAPSSSAPIIAAAAEDDIVKSASVTNMSFNIVIASNEEVVNDTNWGVEMLIPALNGADNNEHITGAIDELNATNANHDPLGATHDSIARVQNNDVPFVDYSISKPTDSPRYKRLTDTYIPPSSADLQYSYIGHQRLTQSKKDSSEEMLSMSSSHERALSPTPSDAVSIQYFGSQRIVKSPSIRKDRGC